MHRAVRRRPRTDDDRAIDTYRDALLAEAELARRDLDEIEDHLRALAEELQSSGMPRAEAIAEACRRLGDPGAVAREHARVRSPFGARLAPLRAWSAAVLLVPWWLAFARLTLGPGGPGLASTFGVNLVIATAVMCGLVARTSWARAILVGALSWVIVDRVIACVGSDLPAGTYELWRDACLTGAFMFVAPWRRAELARAGYVIALLAWAYHGACEMASYQLARPGQLPFVDPAGTVAFVATLAAGVGTLVRARWAAIAAAAAAPSLAIGIAELRTLPFPVVERTAAIVERLGGIAAAAVAAAVAAVLAWRGTRAALGTLRHVLD